MYLCTSSDATHVGILVIDRTGAGRCSSIAFESTSYTPEITVTYRVPGPFTSLLLRIASRSMTDALILSVGDASITPVVVDIPDRHEVLDVSELLPNAIALVPHGALSARGIARVYRWSETGHRFLGPIS